MYQNRVHLIGYLGKNPEHKSVKTTDRKYAVLSLATQRSWKGADEEWHSKTEWHRIVAWNGLGEYAATKLRKGDHIYVEGTLVSSTYQKEFGKGKNKITVPLKTWQVKADSIRKLNRTKKDQVPTQRRSVLSRRRFHSELTICERASASPEALFYLYDWPPVGVS